MGLFYRQVKSEPYTSLHFGKDEDSSVPIYDYIQKNADFFCDESSFQGTGAKSLKAPIYMYDLNIIKEYYNLLVESFKSLNHQPNNHLQVYYAVKANPHPEILKTLSQLGAGVDVVSGGEIQRALECEIPAEKIIYSGVGKTGEEIRLALEKGIKQINVESSSELFRIGQIARTMGKKADVAFRFNPDVNALTHPYITTGFRNNKFGMDEGMFPALLEILNDFKEELNLVGLTLHIGSQLLDVRSIFEAIKKTIPLYERLKAAGHPLKRFDVGGGVGINYKKNKDSTEIELIREYGRKTSELLSPLGCEIMIEPGRWLVGRAGVLITQIQYIKKSMHKNFLIVDTGMHHLLRPCLYQAYHRILPLHKKQGPCTVYDVVGPICESSDVLGVERQFSPLNEGDILAIADCGAYGFSMVNQYNLHSPPTEHILS